MCRMCVVDVKGPRGWGLLPACYIPVAPDMEVQTTSPRVKKAQDGVLEMLLINHPLDCPVCDKGGECPLQDHTLAFGPGESRMVEEKRHFEKPVPISDLVLPRPRALHHVRPLHPLRRRGRRRPASSRSSTGATSRRSTSSPTTRSRPTSPATPCRSARWARSPPARTASRPGRGTSTRSRAPAPPAPSGAGSRCSRRPTRSPGSSASTARPSTTAGCATRAASATRPSTPSTASRHRSCARAASSSRSRGARPSTPPPTGLRRAVDLHGPGAVGVHRRRPLGQRGRVRLGPSGQGRARHRQRRLPAR